MTDRNLEISCNCIVDSGIVDIEEQLVATRDDADRHRLLQIFIKSLAGFQNDAEYAAIIGSRIEINDERYKRQKKDSIV